MNRKSLAKLMDEVFVPCGFKRKGYYWVDNMGKIIKLINLQKSNFGNLFYINYGYILKNLPLENELMHIYNRLSSKEVRERESINELLNFENEISDNERAARLRKILTENLLVDIQSINSEDDLLKKLKTQPNLNTVPRRVRNYFNID